MLHMNWAGTGPLLKVKSDYSSSSSPDHIQAQQEKAFLIALGVDEEE